MTKTKNVSCAMASSSRPTLPATISPASAMLWTCLYWHLNCPRTSAVYAERIPMPKIANAPLPTFSDKTKMTWARTHLRNETKNRKRFGKSENPERYCFGDHDCTTSTGSVWLGPRCREKQEDACLTDARLPTQKQTKSLNAVIFDEARRGHVPPEHCLISHVHVPFIAKRISTTQRPRPRDAHIVIFQRNSAGSEDASLWSAEVLI